MVLPHPAEPSGAGAYSPNAKGTQTSVPSRSGKPRLESHVQDSGDGSPAPSVPTPAPRTSLPPPLPNLLGPSIPCPPPPHGVPQAPPRKGVHPQPSLPHTPRQAGPSKNTGGRRFETSTRAGRSPERTFSAPRPRSLTPGVAALEGNRPSLRHRGLQKTRLRAQVGRVAVGPEVISPGLTCVRVALLPADLALVPEWGAAVPKVGPPGSGPSPADTTPAAPATAAHSCVKTLPRGGVFAASTAQLCPHRGQQRPGNPSFHGVRLSATKRRHARAIQTPWPFQGKDFGPQDAPFLLRDPLWHTRP